MRFLLWAAGPVFELPVVALAISSFPDVAAEAAFGSAGSQAVALVAMVLVLAAVTFAWVVAAAGLRRVLALLLGITSGLLVVLMVGFGMSGTWVVFAVLLAHSAVATAVIGWLLVSRPSPAQSARLGQ
ncbi:hypothetical protein [Micromonospora arborensis]|uniref:hypothetical protein n=1 Tax=Micromonospora arborensis TaxID=2116518 RepID=UPI001FC92984|nr:hypothetical protein [Micromonospora arborensis]